MFAEFLLVGIEQRKQNISKLVYRNDDSSAQ